MPLLRTTLIVLGLLLAVTRGWAAAEPTPEPARTVVVRAILAGSAAEQRKLISSLAGRGDDAIPGLLDAWRKDALFLVEGADGAKIPVQLVGAKDAADAQAAIRVLDGEPLRDAAGRPRWLVAADLVAVEHTSGLRAAMKAVLDLADLAAADDKRRLAAIEVFGKSQAADRLAPLQRRLEVETSPKHQAALREGIALIQLKDASDAVKIAACDYLRDHPTVASKTFLEAALKAAEAAGKPELVEAARRAVVAAERHVSSVNFFGTIFRSLSLGSILLVVALGLSITFGLMGVINMAHGEMIAIGAYTTYVVQNIFSGGLALSPFGFSIHLPGFNATGWGYQSYFLVALPLSFLAAAVVGIGLERSVIRFLYRRPLESLLATWGVSLVLQQLLKFTFGANNVQVSSPTWLSGNWTISDVLLGWNRVFVIVFAVLIVVGVWAVLTKTSLGLLMRSVMQNRQMASCMGVRTERVNMLTFGLGSGLAGLAGAFLSQIGNVGPTLGQGYIVDSFMVVVLGGVGSITGTAIAAFGIGTADQGLQQYAGLFASGFSSVPGVGGFLQNLAQDSAVFGKITVLCGIILFLQWRPAGIFVTRSRSLEG